MKSIFMNLRKQTFQILIKVAVAVSSVRIPKMKPFITFAIKKHARDPAPEQLTNR